MTALTARIKLMARRQQATSQRLRKQPKMRRVQSTHALPIPPRLAVPQAARKRRRRNQRSRRRARLPAAALKRAILSARWISLGLLALTIYALVLISQDGNFYLTMIPVEGAVSIPTAEIVEASQLAGAHVFAVDPALAAERIAELPGVINAAVTLTWPNRVFIEVQEDSPVLVWQDGGQQFWVLADGQLIPARATIPGMLVIESEMPVTAAAGDEPADDEAALATPPQASLAFVPEDVMAGAQQLRQLRPNIDKLYYRPSGGLSYRDGRNWRVYFGAGEDMSQKLVIYETIVAELLARGLTPAYISVSNQEKPYYQVSE